jgi:hypothetical protein
LNLPRLKEITSELLFNGMSLMRILPLVILGFLSLSAFGQHHVLDRTMHYVRNNAAREWSEFPAEVNERSLVITFSSKKNAGEQTLSLRQYDVKQTWKVLINGKDIGMLPLDEKDMITYFPLFPGILLDGKNTLEIKTTNTDADDIKIGNLTIDNRPLHQVLSEAEIEISIFDKESKQLIPGRITIVNMERVLQTVTSPTKEMLAIRPGCVYTGDGKAIVQLPAGSYTVYAGRGFEYGIDSVRIDLKPGDRIQKILNIQREVNTEGWVSSDTHVHTLTHSGHGDATIDERVITLAGEGIEFPIATDHNIYVDLVPAARSKKVLQYFTPVAGDEFTTKVGHFNVFPVRPGSAVMDHNVINWSQVTTNIPNSDASKIIILNHARDVHNNFRPFDPTHHIASTGTRSDDWAFPANAMEIINSGSQQTDVLQLFHDWMGMCNHGDLITPVGSSDSHDVSRFTVGQGRTYIRSDNKEPSSIDIKNTLSKFLNGKVMVSLGLLTKIFANDVYGPGDFIPSAKQLKVSVEVLGPSWVQADRVSLYSNGKKIREEKIDKTAGPLKWSHSWNIPLPSHDIYLVAMAEGPADGMPWWPIAKPYQPVSIEWKPRLFGSTGAVRIDADKDGKYNSPNEYATKIVESSQDNVKEMVRILSSYDEAVAGQVATLLWKRGMNLHGSELKEALRKATSATRSAFETVEKEISLIKK